MGVSNIYVQSGFVGSVAGRDVGSSGRKFNVVISNSPVGRAFCKNGRVTYERRTDYEQERIIRERIYELVKPLAKERIIRIIAPARFTDRTLLDSWINDSDRNTSIELVKGVSAEVDYRFESDSDSFMDFLRKADESDTKVFVIGDINFECPWWLRRATEIGLNVGFHILSVDGTVDRECTVNEFVAIAKSNEAKFVKCK